MGRLRELSPWRGVSGVRGTLLSILGFGFSGGAFYFFITGPWYGGVLLIVAYAVLAAGPRSLSLLATARSLSGLTMVVPVSPMDRREATSPAEGARYARIAVRSLVEAVEPSRRIELLLASGFRTIGTNEHEGWLLKALQEKRENLHLSVLLIDPGCEGARDRAGRVMPRNTFEQYQAGVQAVLWTLRQLSESGAEVEVRLYNEAPIWQMIRLPKELWLLSAVDFMPTDQSPFYVFRRDRPYSLAWGLDAVWARRWEGAGQNLDLSTVHAPQAGSVIAVDGYPWK